MRGSPERLAWSVLLASFTLCCALTVGVPSAAWSFINTATVTPVITVKLQAGRTIAFSPPATEADARVVSQDGRALEEGATVVVDDDGQSQALLTIVPQGAVTDTLITLQLYSGARVRIERARLPRFPALSSEPAEFVLFLQAGRMQVQSQHGEDERVKLEVRTELAVATLGDGSYAFETTGEQTAVSTREGTAWVVAVGVPGPLIVQANQRTAVTQDGGLQGILPPSQDLLRNGVFESPLAPNWLVSAEVAATGDLSGTVSIVGAPPATSVLLDRSGQNLGWGRTGVSQEISADVSGRRSLQLRLVFSILYQELPVCGGLGSECPLMVTVAYRNTQGADREWTQGFYADGTPSTDLPDEIVTAPQPRTKHVAKRLGVRETFESEDLLSTLGDVQQVQSIRIYAEGHAVRAQVYSVELLLTD
jgi:hypothetical protein